MKSNDQYSVILVYSTSHALRIEKVLVKAGFGCRLVPVPRALSSDCGVCVRILRSDKNAIQQILSEKNAEFESICDTGY